MLLKINFINYLFDNLGFAGGMTIIGVAALLVVTWLVLAILKNRDKQSEINTERWIRQKKAMEVVEEVQRREHSASSSSGLSSPAAASPFAPAGKSVNSGSGQIRRPSHNPDPNRKPERENNAAESVDGKLVVNGYLQKSNTAPIRPVYSNTGDARREQKKELDSDIVGEEAVTPALVMDSAAPSKIKPTELKRPAAPQVGGITAEAGRAYITGGVAESETERTTAFMMKQSEHPDMSGNAFTVETAPTATKPLPGFAPKRELTSKSPVKRPKSASISRNAKETGDDSK